MNKHNVVEYEDEDFMEDEDMQEPTNKLARMVDVKDTLMYKLRLSRLDKTTRILQDNRVTDSNGFLTIEGAQVYLDYLWQADKEAHTKLATELDRTKKKEKK